MRSERVTCRSKVEGSSSTMLVKKLMSSLRMSKLISATANLCLISSVKLDMSNEERRSRFSGISEGSAKALRLDGDGGGWVGRSLRGEVRVALGGEGGRGMFSASEGSGIRVVD